MKLLLKSAYFVSLVLVTLFADSCYPAHSGSGSSLSSGGNSSSSSFTIAGAVSGMTGSGLVLQDNGGDNLTIIANGAFAFKTAIASGKAYSVSVLAQPSGPAQVCTISGGSGTASANVNTIQVNCSASGVGGSSTVGGQVTGLVGSGLVLQDNGGDSLAIKANGAFTFATVVTGSYKVTVSTQPTGPTQTCGVTNGTGVVSGLVNNVLITCGDVFAVGGTLAGVSGTGMVLQDNGGDNFNVTGNGAFTFATPLATGAAYAVTILTQPSVPTQTCFVANSTGTVNGNITNIQITCSQVAYTIGGSVVGLITGPGDTLELQDNAGDDLFVTGNTAFTFATPVTSGGIYNVNVFLEPTSQPNIPCNLFFYTGIATANVSDVIVDCQHNDWNFISYYVPGSEKSNNTPTVVTPLFPPKTAPPPANNDLPGGRDFAASWTDAAGRKWIFGGNGFPYPSPFGPQLPGFLNDLWVFDGTWVPANLPTFQNTSGVWVVDPTPLEAVDQASGSAPGGRWGSSSWTDASGNLWLFGGQGGGLLNDLWEWIPGGPDPNGAGTFTGSWINQRGPTPANYGTMGTPSTLNIPGGRWAAATYTDTAAGNVWLFGGQGIDSAGNTGILGDLWKYNIASGQWTWVSGSNLANPNGVYGTKLAGALTNAPGGRQGAVLWVDVSGNLWLFGGFGFDSVGTGSPAGATLNDLWEFTGGQWTWVSGGNIANQTGVYGTETTPAAANFPGSRWGSVGWTDASSNLWLYGGWGYGSIATDPTGFLDDIWEYQHSTGQWIWWKGTNGVNQSSQYITALGSGIPFVKNIAGARRGASIWKQDAKGDVWIFGGEGYDFSSGNPPGYLDDLWNYLPFP